MLALVLGVVFAYRASMDGAPSADGDTDVAGAVIERSEEPEFTETPQDDAAEPLVRPTPRREVAQRDPIVEQPDPPAAPAPGDEPVGLVRDDDPVVVVEPDDDPAPASPRPDRNQTDPDPEPAPDPAPRPRPRPQPEPEPEPQPEPTAEPAPDTRQYELREGEGLSRDTATAYETGNSGKYEWEFRSIAGDGSQDAATRRSRQAQARLSVGFWSQAKESQEQVRTFRCDAVLTAGTRRLLTDTDHVFEIALWTSDGYSPQTEVAETRTEVSQAWDMAPGTSRRLLSKTYELDAADGGSYTCRAIYRSL